MGTSQAAFSQPSARGLLIDGLEIAVEAGEAAAGELGKVADRQMDKVIRRQQARYIAAGTLMWTRQQGMYRFLLRLGPLRICAAAYQPA